MVTLNAFYAYASFPNEVADAAANTIKLVNELNCDLRIVDWAQLSIAGKVIIDEICRNIDEADFFICDLSTHNHNVLFELGFAIAKRKRIWITLNSAYANAERRYRELKLITTVGYIGYRTEFELRNRLLEEFKEIESLPTILGAHENIILSRKDNFDNSLFYMKSWKETPESIALDRALYKAKLTPIYDDPQQGTGQSLAWYIENTFHATAVLAHLTSSGNLDSGQEAKYALAAGLAYGFDKDLLILAHAPHTSPIDYRHIAFEHRNPQSCVAEFRRWSMNIARQRMEVTRPTVETETPSRDLRNVDIGHFLAENEELRLPNYFVETAAYFEALDAVDYVLFVGRKGTGKTANLLMLEQSIGLERDTHVCKIRPARYEFEGILNLFGISKTRSETGYLLNAIWKFLVYTELAFSVVRDIKSQRYETEGNKDISAFLDYVAENEDLIDTGFAERLENALRRLCEMEIFVGTPEEKTKVSEILHT